MKKGIIATLVIIVLLCGCSELNRIIPSQVNTKVGDVFADNRDGYRVRLNDAFFAEIDFHYDEIDICKTNDHSFDANENYTVYYTGIINKLYCSNDYLIACLSKDNDYIVIDCNNINNTKTYKSLSETNFDLSMFAIIDM